MRTEFEIRLTEHLESALGMVSEARKENALLREALEAVEWIEGLCPWCLNIEYGDFKPFVGHKPDCLRQRALGKAEC